MHLSWKLRLWNIIRIGEKACLCKAFGKDSLLRYGSNIEDYQKNYKKIIMQEFEEYIVILKRLLYK
jgi:hypothetical protein